MNQRPITARIGRWTVRLVHKGERYGLDDVLLHDEDDPLVEFYDAEQSVQKFGPLGQFVNRYYASTLLARNDPHAPLALDMGTPEWTVSAEEAEVVSAWLSLMCTYDR